LRFLFLHLILSNVPILRLAKHDTWKSVDLGAVVAISRHKGYRFHNFIFLNSNFYYLLSPKLYEEYRIFLLTSSILLNVWHRWYGFPLPVFRLEWCFKLLFLSVNTTWLLLILPVVIKSSSIMGIQGLWDVTLCLSWSGFQSVKQCQ
jgi:hypothetical protein